MKDKRQQIFELVFLLIACLLTACTFTDNKAELDDPFGRDYEMVEIVYRTPIISDEELGEKVPGLRVREDCVTYVDVGGYEWECSAAEKFALTKQNFDEYFNAGDYKNGAQDESFGWTESGMDAAKLRRENANAWKFTTLSPTDGMTNLQYLLQQKDGTVYLAMGYDADDEVSSEVLNGTPVFLLVFRLAEKVMPTYASIEEYVNSVIDGLKQPNGYTYTVIGADGMALEVTEAAADVRVTELEKLGDCTDLAPDGVLELWSFNYQVKPEDKAGALPDRFFWVGGNYISDDGYISDGFWYYLIVLRTNGEPGVYKLLDSHMVNDGLWYNGCGYENTYEYLYDFYADYAGLDVPRYMITDFLNANDLIRENVVTSSDDCTARRYNGDGWYLYVPTVAWTKTVGQDSWYSAYCDGSTLCVDKSADSVEMMEDFYREGGFTLEQYREGAALSGPWLRYDAESNTQFANYLAPDPDYGGCYIISAYWNPTDDTSVNEWGYSTRNRILNEAVKLRAMAQSFTVSGNVHSYVPTFQNDLDLASEGRAAWLYLVENSETVGGYSVRGAWNVPTLNAYHYVTCDAPKDTGRQLALWLSNNDSSYFVFYEGTNIVAYHRSMTDPVDYYEAQDNFSIVDNDGRTLYDVIRAWYDEAELSALREEIGPLDKSLSWQEATQQWADLYDGVHLNVTTGSEYKYIWVKTSVKPSEETTAAFRENGRIDENTYCFFITTEFVAESEWALSRSMAGNTGNCDDPDAPEGAYEYYRCCTITLEENGWHGEMCGTGW